MIYNYREKKIDFIFFLYGKYFGNFVITVFFTRKTIMRAFCETYLQFDPVYNKILFFITKMLFYFVNTDHINISYEYRYVRPSLIHIGNDLVNYWSIIYAANLTQIIIHFQLVTFLSNSLLFPQKSENVF